MFQWDLSVQMNVSSQFNREKVELIYVGIQGGEWGLSEV